MHEKERVKLQEVVCLATMLNLISIWPVVQWRQHVWGLSFWLRKQPS